VIVVTAHGGEGDPADATCPKEAPLAIAGGSAIDDKGGVILVSAPITEHELSKDGQQPNGWRTKASTDSYTGYAICTRTGGKEVVEEEEPGKESAEVPVKK
jgi:hypothetical protein